ncbi:MAG: hypothetical protein M3Q30_18320 [Actinomycetota bacterium]|nr:hypothetical protein [Actinomycetota bacterium]
MPTLTIPIPSRENVRAKALRLLVEGRVRVLSLDQGRLRAVVRGDAAEYRVSFDRGNGWHCHCPSPRCSHARAVAMVVDVSGWEGGTDNE